MKYQKRDFLIRLVYKSHTRAENILFTQEYCNHFNNNNNNNKNNNNNNNNDSYNNFI